METHWPEAHLSAEQSSLLPQDQHGAQDRQACLLSSEERSLVECVAGTEVGRLALPRPTCIFSPITLNLSFVFPNGVATPVTLTSTMKGMEILSAARHRTLLPRPWMLVLFIKQEKHFFLIIINNPGWGGGIKHTSLILAL